MIVTGKRLLLEICVDEPASLVAAIDGGADRIELCSALALGGLTPSAALVALARTEARSAPVHAMVRPRAGDFTYGEAEAHLAVGEARALLAAGVDGLVFGATRDSRLDLNLLRRWVAAVRAIRPDVSLTLHRAIDTVADPVTGVAEACALGFNRVLTSGGAPSAPEGAATIRRMALAAGDDAVIVAGAGITAANVQALIEDTGVREVHASAGCPVPPLDERVAALGFADPPRRVTDAREVRALRDLLDRHWRPSP